MKEPFEIPNILESLAADVKDGVITIEDAAKELNSAGWTAYIDEEKTVRLLRIEGRVF